MEKSGLLIDAEKEEKKSVLRLDEKKCFQGGQPTVLSLSRIAGEGLIPGKEEGSEEGGERRTIATIFKKKREISSFYFLWERRKKSQLSERE